MVQDNASARQRLLTDSPAASQQPSDAPSPGPRWMPTSRQWRGTLRSLAPSPRHRRAVASLGDCAVAAYVAILLLFQLLPILYAPLLCPWCRQAFPKARALSPSTIRLMCAVVLLFQHAIAGFMQHPFASPYAHTPGHTSGTTSAAAGTNPAAASLAIFGTVAYMMDPSYYPPFVPIRSKWVMSSEASELADEYAHRYGISNAVSVARDGNDIWLAHCDIVHSYSPFAHGGSPHSSRSRRGASVVAVLSASGVTRGREREADVANSTLPTMLGGMQEQAAAPTTSMPPAS